MELPAKGFSLPVGTEVNQRHCHRGFPTLAIADELRSAFQEDDEAPFPTEHVTLPVAGVSPCRDQDPRIGFAGLLDPLRRMAIRWIAEGQTFPWLRQPVVRFRVAGPCRNVPAGRTRVAVELASMLKTQNRFPHFRRRLPCLVFRPKHCVPHSGRVGDLRHPLASAQGAIRSFKAVLQKRGNEMHPRLGMHGLRIREQASRKPR